MKRTLTLILLSASVLQSISAQDRAVRIKAERKENKSIELVAEVKGPGTYTAMASFDNLENASQPKVIIKTVKYGGNFHTLYPLDKNRPIGYTTMWSGYINGTLNPKADTEFVYRLPYATGKNYVIRSIKDMGEEYFGKEREMPLRAYQFTVEQGDSVFAMRKGVVKQIHDGEKPVPVDGDAKVSYSSNANYMIIEHDDGTLARYTVLQNGSFMVKEWDIVYPGTPLALAGTYDNKTFQVRVHVAYYIYDKSINAATVQEVKENVVRCYIEPVFATTQGDLRPVMGEQYTAVETEAMVTKEMDRKELKNYKGKK